MMYFYILKCLKGQFNKATISTNRLLFFVPNFAILYHYSPKVRQPLANPRHFYTQTTTSTTTTRQRQKFTTFDVNQKVCQMDIKKDALYSIKETSDFTMWSVRKLQRHAKKLGIKKIDNRYLFYGYQIEQIILLKSGLNDNVTTTTENDKGEKTTEVQMNVVDILNKEIENLRNERDYLKEKYETDTTSLKAELTKDIPHQEKLKAAIRLITLEAMEQGVTHKVFTEEEYTDIIGTITEVDFQKEQVEYLRGRVEKQDTILEKLVQQVSERNFIEAKEKGLDQK